MINEKKSVNITVKIKFGKYMPDATFELEGDAEMNVFNSHGNMICLSMYIGGQKMDQDSMKRYFTNKSNYQAIKKEWYKEHGEIT